MNTQERIMDFADTRAVHDALFYIEKLHCNHCDVRVNFYLYKKASYCECCHNEVEITKADFESVADRSPRAAILRFAGTVGCSPQ